MSDTSIDNLAPIITPVGPTNNLAITENGITNKISFNNLATAISAFIGAGDVGGPGSSTNRAIAIWDGTTGTALLDTDVIIDGSNNINGINNLVADGQIEAQNLELIDVGNFPLINSTFTEAVPASNIIFEIESRGLNDATPNFETIIYAKTITTQDVITDGIESGSILFQVESAGSLIDILKLDGDGDGTSPQIQASVDLIMTGTNAIQFPDANWKIFDDSASGNILLFETIDGGNGRLGFTAGETSAQFILSNAFFGIEVNQVGPSLLPSTTAFELGTRITTINDDGDEPIMAIDFDKGVGAAIEERPLFQFQNLNITKWLLDNDGTVTQFGNLIMGSNQIEFEDSSHRILQSGDDLQIRSLNTGSTTLFLGGDFYRFDTSNADWNNNNLIKMGVLSFGDVDHNIDQFGNNMEIHTGGGGTLRFFNDVDLTYQFGASEANWLNQDLINMGILKFSNANNRLFESGGGSLLTIEANSQLSLKTVGTVQFFTVSSTFIEWQTDTNFPPKFITQAKQGTPTFPRNVTTWEYKGQNDTSLSVIYARMDVNQEKIVTSLEDGSMVFSVMRAGSVTPFVNLNGVTGNLELQQFVNIDFTDNVGTGTLTLETDSSDDLKFNGNVVKTLAVSTTKRQESNGTVNTGVAEAILTDLGLTSRVDRPGGLELLIYNLEIEVSDPNKQFDMAIKLGTTKQPSVRLNIPTSNRIVNVPFITVVPTDGQDVQLTIDNSQGNNTALEFKGGGVTAANITRLTTMEIA